MSIYLDVGQYIEWWYGDFWLAVYNSLKGKGYTYETIYKKMKKCEKLKRSTLHNIIFSLD